MKIKLKQDVYDVPTGSPVRKQLVREGQEVEVEKSIGQAMIDSGQAELVKKRRGSAQEGPEETR